MTQRLEIDLWVQTHRPIDLPGAVDVCRRWDFIGGSLGPTDEYMLGSLDDIRAEMTHRGLSFCVRDENDDPVIVGTWF